jgi:DNA (cytosine-5)-methyltransferase 1
MESFSSKMNNKITFIDLFAGIGGFRIALANLGGQCINFSEINVDAINTYCSNFSEKQSSNLGDITKVSELPKHDLLTAGVPCQSWSIAGKNLGFDDDRGQLWNDTIYLLHQAKPKAFIFENVKGLADPRNSEALLYILKRIKDAGYFANYYVLNSYDYGVPQNRVRIYIVGFEDKKFHDKFKLPLPVEKKLRLGDIIGGCDLPEFNSGSTSGERDLFGKVPTQKRSMSLSNNHGFNDYFLFNDIRNGHTTIHSWDILDTTERQKSICLLLLKNRRKSAYGDLDGNPLSLDHFKGLDRSIAQSELDELIEKNILKKEDYSYKILKKNPKICFTDQEELILSLNVENKLIPDILTTNRELKLKRVSVKQVLDSLLEKEAIISCETRYDFKFTKISTGLFGVNRIFLPTSNIFPTLVASDSNDFITTIAISADNENYYKNQFVKKIYNSGNYRKITRQEACKIQGFPDDFILPDSRSRWMKLIGNSVSVPVVEMIGKAIVKTGVFINND